MPSETDLDVDIRKAPKKGEFARVIWKPQSGAEKKGLKEKKAKFDPVPASRPKRGVRTKSDLDEVIESGKMETTKSKYHIIPPLLVQELIDEIIKDGNLENISIYYKNMDDNDKRQIEEAVVLYVDVFSKALIEL